MLMTAAIAMTAAMPVVMFARMIMAMLVTVLVTVFMNMTVLAAAAAMLFCVPGILPGIWPGIYAVRQRAARGANFHALTDHIVISVTCGISAARIKNRPYSRYRVKGSRQFF